MWWQYFLVWVVALGILFMTYILHFSYPFPIHIDEWHHLTEATRILDGSWEPSSTALRIGFQLILSFFSLFLPLVSVYKFLPALWISFSSIVLFFATYLFFDRRFWIALWTQIFFGTLRTHVTLLGPMFFVPLTFSFPFIVGFLFLFVSGLEQKNSRYLYCSFGIALLLLVVHAISFLFMLPLLSIILFLYRSSLREMFRPLSLFILLCPIGFVFLMFALDSSPYFAVVFLFSQIIFPRGWGVVEKVHLIPDFYGPLGAVLALFGATVLFSRRKQIPRRFLLFLLWPSWLIFMMGFYFLLGYSPLSPYQRNVMYFALSLPFLSAYGLVTLFSALRKHLDFSVRIVLFCLLVCIVILFSYSWHLSLFSHPFQFYYPLSSDQASLYLELSSYPSGIVLADPLVAVGSYVLSGHNPYETVFFYRKGRQSDEFFRGDLSCAEKERWLSDNNISYILSESLSCPWEVLAQSGPSRLYAPRLTIPVSSV